MAGGGGRPRVAVVGAGPAGLAAAVALAEGGARVTVLDAAPALGGLARAVPLWGRAYELGSHIVHGGDRRALALFARLAGDDLVAVPLRRAVLVRGRLTEYPLRPAGAARALGARGAARAAAGLAAARLRPAPPPAGPESTEAWMARRFGRPLYDALFRDYAAKLWGRPPAEVDAAFAAGLVGARQASGDAGQARGPRGHFLHPAAGLGAVWARAAARVQALGGAVRLGEAAESLHTDGAGRVAGVRTAAGPVDADAVVASMPLGALVRALPGDAPGARAARAAAGRLRARHTALVYLRARAARPPAHAWVHLYDPALRAGRVTNFAAWDARRGGGDAVFALEYWCDPDDATWLLPDDTLAALAERELVASGIAGRVVVADAHVERLRGTHPVPLLGYAAHVAAARAFCATFAGLEVVGRHGTFAVDSVADAMAAGLDAAGRTLRGLGVRTRAGP